MNRSRALSAWLQVPVGVVLLAAGLCSPFLVAEDIERAGIVASGQVCTPGTAVGAEDCLVPVEGRLTDQRGRTSRRYHFEPTSPVVPGAEDEWVRFPGDETARGGATAALVAGAPATALHAGDEIVAFDVEGERVTEMSGEPGDERTTVWGGLWLGSLGAMMLLAAWARSRSGGSAPDAGTSGTPVVVLTVVMLGSFCALFAGSLRAELTTFAVAAGLVGGLVGVGRARQRRTRRTA